MLTGERSDTLIEVQAWPAEACYFGSSPETPDDLCLHFLDFVAQSACFLDVKKPFSAILDDILNLSTSLAKVRHFQSAQAQIPHGRSRMATTEIEYIALICRSIFDSLQEIIAKLWDKLVFSDETIIKKKLKTSFREMIELGGNLQSAEQISERFKLPVALAKCYERATDNFIALRRFRDNIVHHGSQVQNVFTVDDNFLISHELTPFPNLVLWTDSERQENDLVPLLPALQMLIFRTMAICEDFSLTLGAIINYPPNLVPGMHLVLRGFFLAQFVEALTSSKNRV